MRGTFGNMSSAQPARHRARKGGWTLFLPDGEKMSIYDAAGEIVAEGRCAASGHRLGKEYGSGSSPRLGGERHAAAGRARGHRPKVTNAFHRSNLVGMGVLPLEFKQGEKSCETLSLTGSRNIRNRRRRFNSRPKKPITVSAKSGDGRGKDVLSDCARGHAGRSFLLPTRRHSAIRVVRADALAPS